MPAEPYQNLIAGTWETAKSGETFPNSNPANLSDHIGDFQQSVAADVQRAVESAAAAFPAWRATPPAARAERLDRAVRLVDERRSAIAQEITRENGKTLAESQAEILSAQKEMAYQIGQGVRIQGETRPSEREGILCCSFREPLGVIAVITPWNFPFNVVCRKSIPALVSGNCVVFKPASFTPLVGLRFAEVLHDAGIPPGVFNLITGRGPEVGDALVQHADVRAVSFTGSTKIGREVERKAIARGAKAQAEMGGKNPAVVLEDADLDEAADAISLAAFACAGQWCTSTSRVVVLESVFEPLMDRLVERAERLVVGSGLDPATTMGPVAGRVQLESILGYLDVARQEGVQLAIGGHQLTSDGLDAGTFVAPTILTGVRTDMRIAREEIFGPVLSVLVAQDFQHAVEIANDVPYGLSSSIFTRDLDRALTFVEKTHVGLTHVNMPTAYKEVTMDFGGIKDSGTGLPEAGASGIEFFTEHKVAYVKYR